jgi:hypothetical protein
MRLATFLSLCGLSSAAYANMVRRDYAPSLHYDVDEHGNPVKEPGWTEYTRRDVVMTSLAVALDGEGLSKRTATAMVVFGRKLIDLYWPVTVGAGNEPIQFGGAQILTGGSEMWLPVAGTFSDLVVQTRSGDHLRLSDGGYACRKLVAVNMTMLRGEIEERARRAGVPADFDHLQTI